jgi:hypothetical protein
MIRLESEDETDKWYRQAKISPISESVVRPRRSFGAEQTTMAPFEF